MEDPRFRAVLPLGWRSRAARIRVRIAGGPAGVALCTAVAPWLCVTAFRRLCSEQRPSRVRKENLCTVSPRYCDKRLGAVTCTTIVDLVGKVGQGRRGPETDTQRYAVGEGAPPESWAPSAEAPGACSVRAGEDSGSGQEGLVALSARLRSNESASAQARDATASGSAPWQPHMRSEGL